MWAQTLQAMARQGISREAYTDSVLAALDVVGTDVLFRLLWLPEETGELLGS